ncbi:MAG: 16S rRNA (cytidine(1402)-2'-O)-methyltransferase [Pikeienuella sp.]
MTPQPRSKRDESGESTSETTTLSEPAKRLPQGLYLAATPIGAADDLTIRARDALMRADVIAAEDTRMAQKLMMIHGVPRAGRPIVPYHDHNGAEARPRLLARVAEGGSVVCVSDAGTPMVADPGWKLARDAIDQELPVIALPGASALLTALTVSGLPTDRFMFCGFLPPKQTARRTSLTELAAVPGTLVFYESPRRLAAVLADMMEVLGPREAAVSRELTKKFEETRRGPLSELASYYAETGAPKGEVVISVGPPQKQEIGEADLDDALIKALATMRVKDAAQAVSTALGLPRRDVYNRALAIKE